ncbi:hypothetical protein DY000_02056239 [Brassica cretica]|uniref:Uncharacterized protein n=1 Tax=Brassica cretica TaxID=69181 RepID=A0ABQ7A7F1_BRACR|nr:hypothetical protein DY000_02056239 [Brassica cretica]
MEETMKNKKKNDDSKKKERHIVTWSQEFGRCLGMMIATGTLVFTLDTYHPELVPETLNAFSTDMEAGGGGKPDAALVMDWSVEEHYVLENGLAKLKDEPKISKYVKIAAALPEKTVRDVAMRCSWMTVSFLMLLWCRLCFLELSA